MLPSPKLPDVLVPGLRVVFCGTAAGDKSAAVGAYYAGPGNQFWSTLHTVGLTPRRLAPSDFSALPEYGIGLTDIAKYYAGNDANLGTADFNVPVFREKLENFQPRVLAFNGKKAAAAFYGCGTGNLPYGRQANRIGDTVIWVLPSTSGNARRYWNHGPWRDLAQFVQAFGMRS
ncbi:MAG: glycosylase [Phycisphaerales bacterium]|nr:glycosylase [Phycisphaerales bacterium]